MTVEAEKPLPQIIVLLNAMKEREPDQAVMFSVQLAAIQKSRTTTGNAWCCSITGSKNTIVGRGDSAEASIRDLLYKMDGRT